MISRILFPLFIASLMLAPQQQPNLCAATSAARLEVTVYMVVGSASHQQSNSNEMPRDLAEALHQMESLFSFKTYRLIDAVTLRGFNNSGAETSGHLPESLDYDFKYANATISDNAPHSVRLSGLHLEVKKHRYNKTETVALVSSDLEVRDGQKTVAGKSTLNATDALFLVIVPQVLQ